MSVSRASLPDTAAVVAGVAGAVIARPPRVVGALDRVDADRRAVRRMQRVEDC